MAPICFMWLTEFEFTSNEGGHGDQVMYLQHGQNAIRHQVYRFLGAHIFQPPSGPQKAKPTGRFHEGSGGSPDESDRFVALRRMC